MEILKNIIFVIFSPKMGWEEVKRSCIPTGRLFVSTFLPLLIVLALTAFVPLAFDKTATVAGKLMDAIITFASFLVTFYLTSYLLSSLYPEIANSQSAIDRLNDFIIYNLIYLIVLQIIKNLTPVDAAPIFFLMFYMPYIVYKGVDFLGVRNNKQLRFTLLASLMMLLLPVAFIWVFNLFAIN
ncbi:MAG: hypothetical protein IJT30_04625 [Muribaculaceae bacterium]|nr:hypothetical protein [Muribaculaceae bacterium]